MSPFRLVREKTRTVSTEYRRVTDRQTDRQTSRGKIVLTKHVTKQNNFLIYLFVYLLFIYLYLTAKIH